MMKLTVAFLASLAAADAAQARGSRYARRGNYGDGYQAGATYINASPDEIGNQVQSSPLYLN